jgi:predicted nucleic acid-binding Zn ribbon protein
MGKWRDPDDDAVDEDDRDLPLESDRSDDDDPPIDPCPHCGKMVHEEAEWCHHCGNFLSKEDAPPKRVPMWVLIGTALVLGMMAFWMMGR